MKPLVILSIIAGLLLLVLAFVYLSHPANALPTFLPGYDPTLAKHHFKHGIAAALLGLAAFAFAWFQTGKSKK